MAAKKTAKTKRTTAPSSPEVSKPKSTVSKKLTKAANDKVFCGVAAGIAEYLAIDPIFVRLLFVILTVSGGSGILIYIVMCLIVPEASSKAASTQEVINENSKGLEQKIETAAKNVEQIAKQRSAQTWIGIGLVILGAILMANNVGIFPLRDMVKYISLIGWPLALVVIGMIILNKNNDA